MRKTSISAILVLGILGSSLVPAQALFWKSSCAKLTEQNNSEQAIGYENWKIFDQYRDGLIKKQTFAYFELKYALNQLKLVYLSDSKIYSNIEKNKSCFDAKFLARNRQVSDSAKSNLASIAKSNTNLNTYSTDQLNSQVTSVLFEYLKGDYKNFHDWKTNKILSK
jgi:hypothetical protein